MKAKEVELTSSNNFVDFMNRVSLAALCIVLIDCAITGGGHWLMIGTISLRMLMLLISAVCAIPSLFIKLRELIKSPIIINLIVFLFYLGICAYIGIQNGNRMDVLRSDVSGFAWLFLIPVAMVVMTSQKRVELVVKCLVFASIAQALMITIINLYCLFNPNNAQPLFNWFIQAQVGYAETISLNLFRIFTKSSPFLIFGVIGMIYLQIRSEKFNWLYMIGSGLCLSSLLLTFTRSLYGASIALILAAALYLIVFKQRKRLIQHIVLVLISALMLIMLQQLLSGVNYIQFAISRAFSIDVVTPQAIDKGEVTEVETDKQVYIEVTRKSDDFRNVTMEQLKAMINKSPVFGHGLGASISYREDGLVEYFYHDLMNKTGGVGLVLYLLPVGYMILTFFQAWKRRMTELVLMGIMGLCSLSAFLVVSYYNPYMNAALGISCYAVSLASYRLIAAEMKSKAHSVGAAEQVELDSGESVLTVADSD